MMNNQEQQYLDILKELIDKSDTVGFRDVRDGHQRVSLFGIQMRFDLTKGFPLYTHEKVFMRGAFDELMWFLRGENNKYYGKKHSQETRNKLSKNME